VDVMRYATVGVGAPPLIVVEGAAFVVFTVAAFGSALWALSREP
jgi:hypothetical protein